MFFGLFGVVEGLTIGDGSNAFYFERVMALSGSRQWDSSGSKTEDKGIRLAFTLHNHNRFGNHHIWSPNKTKETKLKDLVDLFEQRGADDLAKDYNIYHKAINSQGVAQVQMSRLTWENQFDAIACVLDLKVYLPHQAKLDIKKPPVLKDGSTVQDIPKAAKAASLSPDQGTKNGMLVTLDNWVGSLFAGVGL